MAKDITNIDLFIPCHINQYYPNIAISTVKILERFSIKINYIPIPLCCGKTPYELGYWDEAKKYGENFIKSYSKTVK
jgi:L-lactate dehydrogenase complex protein LldE